MDGEIPALQLAGSCSEDSFPRKIDIKPASCQSWGLLSGGLFRPGNPIKEFPKSKTIGVEDLAGSTEDEGLEGTQPISRVVLQDED